MKRLIISILTLISISTIGQEKNEKIMYVVDSIPVFQAATEEEGDNMNHKLRWKENIKLNLEIYENRKETSYFIL